MADRSPIRFPSPSDLLRDNAPASSAAPVAANDDGGRKDVKHARRPSRESKKKEAAPRKAPAVENKDNTGVAKPKQTKSRNGCITCKQKRLKCGEEKPNCVNCTRKGQKCGGYKKTFQWRDFYETGAKANINQFQQFQPERPKTALATSPVRVSAASSKTTTPTGELPPTIPAQEQESFGARPRRPSTASPSNNDSSPKLRDSVVTPLPADSPDSAPPPPSAAQKDHEASHEFASVHFDPHQAFVHRTRSMSPLNTRGASPTLTEILDPTSQSGRGPQDFVPFSMPDDLSLPWMTTGSDQPGMLGHVSGNDDLELLDELDAMDDENFSWPTRWPSRNTTPVHRRMSPMNIMSNNMNFWNAQSPYLYQEPDFPINSQEYLVSRFDRMTCGILAIADGPTENPWRSIVWPMAHHSPALFHAVLAMTAFHLHVETPQLRFVGQDHKQQSIKYIQEGLRDNSMDDMTAIATALALALAASWEDLTITGNAHIKGAQLLVRRALEAHKINPRTGSALRQLKFLCNAWVYMDVIARLTSVDSDDSIDFDNIFYVENNRRLFTGRGEDRNRGFGIDFGMDIDAKLDPLMGCATTLFPLIGRVANLVRKVCRSQRNAPGIVSHGRDLKKLIEEWEPPEEIESPEDPSTMVDHTIETAEAYRWATLLHLHQAVPELPSMTSAELSQKVLACIATVPLDSRAIVVQIYPLMVAGCEAIDDEDRQWIRERWQVMMSRMQIGVLEKCLSVTEEVWRRKDDYEARPLTQRKLVSTRDLNAARQQRRSTLEPKLRQSGRPTSSQERHPGRTGMVFSFVEVDKEPNKQHGHLQDFRDRSAATMRKRDVSDLVKTDPAYTVRGHCHWVGVMWDWGWEVLL